MKAYIPVAVHHEGGELWAGIIRRTRSEAASSCRENTSQYKYHFIVEVDLQIPLPEPTHTATVERIK